MIMIIFMCGTTLCFFATMGSISLSPLAITEWDFEADPLGVGVTEKWFSPQAKPKLERTIITPGAWQAQGVGNETTLEHHQYQGVGWYRKHIGAPPELVDGRLPHHCNCPNPNPNLNLNPNHTTVIVLTLTLT